MKYSDRKLYDVSAQALRHWERMRKSIIDLLKFWTFRYKVLIDNAPRKFDCPKNQQVYRYWYDDNEYARLISYLKDMKAHINEDIDLLIQTLEAEQKIVESCYDEERL